jgi:hypothetical protein
VRGEQARGVQAGGDRSVGKGCHASDKRIASKGRRESEHWMSGVQVRSEESANRGRGEFKDGARTVEARGEGSASKR